MGWGRIQKLQYLGIGTNIFYEIKKFLTSASDGIFSGVTVW